ncbi:MAG: hypothetical protein Q9193_002224, partial [Seirophora villosa]
MANRLASGNKRTTSSARVRGGTSFGLADELPLPKFTDVDTAAVKTVLYSTEEAAESMHMVHPDPGVNSIALVKAVKPATNPTPYDLRRRPVRSGANAFKVIVSEGEWDEARESVTTKELVVVKFPCPGFMHE